MRVSYTPELIAHIRHRYENTDDTLAKIAEDCCVSERAINRLRDREKWPRRSDRPVRDLPPAMRQLEELTAELAARGPMPARGSGDWPPTPDPSPPLPRVEPGVAAGGEQEKRAASLREATLPLSGGANSSTIDRIEQLVEKALAAEEAVRAQLGPLPRPRREAERAARTLAVLTQTLHALQRLRCGLSPNTRANDYDDMPRDVDEFRRNLARRIDAFVASRTKPGHADGDSGPAGLDVAGS